MNRSNHPSPSGRDGTAISVSGLPRTARSCRPPRAELIRYRFDGKELPRGKESEEKRKVFQVERNGRRRAGPKSVVDIESYPTNGRIRVRREKWRVKRILREDRFVMHRGKRIQCTRGIHHAAEARRMITAARLFEPGVIIRIFRTRFLYGHSARHSTSGVAAGRTRQQGREPEGERQKYRRDVCRAFIHCGFAAFLFLAPDRFRLRMSRVREYSLLNQ